eukprot:6001052-Amphidinium_carterae.1
MTASTAQSFFSTSGGLGVTQRRQMPRPQSRPRAQARQAPEMGRTAPPGSASIARSSHRLRTRGALGFHKFAHDLRIGTAGSNTKPLSREAIRAKDNTTAMQAPVGLPSVRLVEVAQRVHAVDGVV